jgi:hypothetical protein
MAITGRPALHRPEYDAQAHEFCLLGATNAELADVLAVSPRTIDSWIANIPGFAKAVRDGRAIADGRVARSLYERAVGFRLTVERTVLHRGEERKLTNTVQYPPDTQACIFWLRNRRRDLWGNQRPTNDSAESGYDMVAELDAAGERARAELRAER